MTDETYDDEREIPTPTDGDRDAYGTLRDLAARTGRAHMAVLALDAGVGLFPVLVFLAGKGAGIEEVFDTLQLEAGDLEETITWAFSEDAQSHADLEQFLDEWKPEGPVN